MAGPQPFTTPRSVFLTGHTGFKGTWLSHWLAELGCPLTGFALPPDPCSLFEQTQATRKFVKSVHGDIQSADAVKQALIEASPEVVIHFAAQPLVRQSYRAPTETWSVNVLGTINLLEAVRLCPSVKAVLIVTTDKCYENKEWAWGYRESDPLGGHDPYSASKAGAEIATSSYRASFFNTQGPLIATARAGNVIGGGDWSVDRIIPDAARAMMNGGELVVRNPQATRPWQHVLDCLSGYLTLVDKLLLGDRGFAKAYNFGPAVSDNLPVADLLALIATNWPGLRWTTLDADGRRENPHEANYLYLDSSLARQELGWTPGWDLKQASAAVGEWYGSFIADSRSAEAMTMKQLESYLAGR